MRDPLCSWLPVDTPPDLTTGQIDVFCFDLDLSDQHIAKLSTLLSPAEQARSARFLRPFDQRHFICAHGQLRQVLSGYLHTEPTALTFTENKYGKPSLVGAGSPYFNLSHSGSLALLAVSLEREIGIDIEITQREVDFLVLARQFFAPQEVRALFELPSDQQRQAFFACWTRKEAYIKARGMGLSIPLDEFAVSLAPGEPVRLLPPTTGWSLHALDPAPGYAAALAAAGEVDGIRCFHWITK